MGFGLPEFLIIGLIVMLFFGHRLPGLGRALGLGVVKFKEGLAGDEEPAEPVEQAPQKKPKALDYNPETPQD